MYACTACKGVQRAELWFQALEPSGPFPPRRRRFERGEAVEAGLCHAGWAEAAARAAAGALLLALSSRCEYDGLVERVPLALLPPLPVFSMLPEPPGVLATLLLLPAPGTNDGALPAKPRSDEAWSPFAVND